MTKKDKFLNFLRNKTRIETTELDGGVEIVRSHNGGIDLLIKIIKTRFNEDLLGDYADNHIIQIKKYKGD